MRRTKLFVSYSHQDRPWLERLKTHLALLQRKGIVHIWSDTRIEVGARWQDEIDTALGESQAAILLVSPDFLASEFIWNEEIPKLLDHQKQGMLILPLIVRPCAWRIAPELAVLEGRPRYGLPLSLGTEAEADWDLSEFVYEIAGRLGQLPSGIATEEMDRALARRRGGPRAPAAAVGAGLPLAIETFDLIKAGQAWVGSYDSTGRQLRLVIEKREGSQFSGAMNYLDDGSVTEVEGEILGVLETSTNKVLTKLAAQFGSSESGVVFRETSISKAGKQPPEIGGEYLALVTSDRIVGDWRSQGRAKGRIDLRLQV